MSPDLLPTTQPRGPRVVETKSLEVYWAHLLVPLLVSRINVLDVPLDWDVDALAGPRQLKAMFDLGLEQESDELLKRGLAF